MRKLVVVISLFVLSFDALGSDVAVDLNIAPRRQWTNSNGYCGSCCIQMTALYYGNYVSQDKVRKCVGDNEILFGRNLEEALDSLRLTRITWENHSGAVQDYAVWKKQMLHNGHPVIYACRQKGSEYIYDHIIVATGLHAQDVKLYNSNDMLSYNECFETRTIEKDFGTLLKSSTQWNLHPTYHLASAVTGIRDDNGECLPVSVEIDRWDEPNVSLNRSPALLNAAISIRSLEAGKTYQLLRYDDHRNVPTSHFAESQPSEYAVFTAADSTHMVADSFMSDSEVFYRCIPYTRPFLSSDNGQHVSKDSFDHTASSAGPAFASGMQAIIFSEGFSPARLFIFTINGRMVRSFSKEQTNGKHIFTVNGLPAGMYFARIEGAKKTKSHQLLFMIK
ncbi:MAG: T9SS type A sorting domain-containing protein [Fibrobacterota bacterium]